MENMPERRSFRMHPKLLLDVIRRQAGSLSKACLEGIMNSIDAKAGRIDITVTRSSVTIADDGAGFPSREEVEAFFEVFGQPHSESEGKRYGTFRMGRGQMFAFGRNVWRSGEFEMRVDVANDGLEYDLRSGCPASPGCRIEIELYEPLTPLRVVELESEMKRLARYVEPPVFVNGTQVNQPVSTQKWKLQNDDAYMNLTPGGEQGVEVYNLGIHVCNIRSYDCGVGGVIVSKRKLDVNFARNDLMSTCPVWRRIRSEMQKVSKAGQSEHARLTNPQRVQIWRQILAGNSTLSDYRQHKLFVDSNGSALSLDQILSRSYRGHYGRGLTVAFGPHDSRAADRIMQVGLGLVLDEAMLGWAGVSEPEEWMRCFEKQLSAIGRTAGAICVPFAELEARLGPAETQLTPDADLTQSERLGLRVATAIANEVVRYVARQELGIPADDTGYYPELWKLAPSLKRMISAGESVSALAWTDGKTYIAIRRDLLAGARNLAGIVRLTDLICHEYCHRCASIGEHTHDFDFYRGFHDLVLEAGGKVAALGVQTYERGVLQRAKQETAAQKRRRARAMMVGEAEQLLAAG